MKNISVVIPVYNSSEILPKLISELETVLISCTNKHQIILVNDCSKDNSWQIILNLTKQYSFIKGINLMKNYGQHNAILCGINNADYEYIITMDDDLQHPPKEIPNLLEKLSEDIDVVYGIPKANAHNSWRNLSSKVSHFLFKKLTANSVSKDISAFRAFKTELRKAFENYNGRYVSVDMLLTWGTNKFENIEVEHNKRFTGKSNYTFRKLVSYATNLFTSFSALPLQVASILGFIFTLFGIVIFGYVMVNYFVTDGAIKGFTFLAATIAIFSGIQLFVLGILGEYISRIHFRSMKEPYYVIKNIIEDKKP
jgi:undecaprenyl-phosphate 4-deoxy-4-formamido-L-arabinose transferase